MFSLPNSYETPKKTCKECSAEKFIYEFSPSKPKCKECQARNQREYRKSLGSDSSRKWRRFVSGNNLPSEIRGLCFSTEVSR